MESLVEEITGEKYNFKGVKKMSNEELIKYIKDNYAVYDFNKDNIELSVLLYKDGYKQGMKEAFNIYNNEVNDMSNDYSYRLKKIQKENSELKEKIESLKGFEEIQHKIWEMFGSFSELKQMYDRERLNEETERKKI